MNEAEIQSKLDFLTRVIANLRKVSDQHFGVQHGRGTSAIPHPDSLYLSTTDVDDTPVNGATTAPVSSNWAYDISQLDFLVGTASGLLGAEIAVGATPGGELGNTWASPTVDATHSGSSHTGAAVAAVATHEAAVDPHTGYLKESNTIDFLVGTATGELAGEIVVGATPGGELGNTWASPTVDATHSGSTHAATQAAAEATAAAADAAHVAAADPHTVYLKETDFDDIDFLVGTATTHTAAEIVVGTSPGGELGGTWSSPTVDATHSGSAHVDFIPLTIIDAKGDLIVGTAADTPVKHTAGTDNSIPMFLASAGDGITNLAVVATPSTQAFGDAAAQGALTSWAPGNHKHAMPTGAFTSYTFAATDFTASSGNWTVASGDIFCCKALTLGKLFFITFNFFTTTVSATPASLIFNFSNSFGGSAANRFQVLCRILENTTESTGYATVSSAGTTITFTKQSGANFSTLTDLTYITGEMFLELQ